MDGARIQLDILVRLDFKTVPQAVKFCLLARDFSAFEHAVDCALGTAQFPG